MKNLLILAACGFAALTASAESPRWLRNTAISPDGSTIAFTYKGDIFTVPVAGGKASQLTSNEAYDTAPVWSPDGSKIIFSSNREGSFDIFSVAATGGTPVRLTTNSGSETPLAFLNDHEILYTTSDMPARESSRAPFLTQTWKLDISQPGLRPQLFLSLPAGAASVSKSGKVLYQDKKGFENIWRKHERSSGTSDIWLYDNGNFKQLTKFNGHDLNPVWKADGNSFFFISEEDGTLNIYEASLDGKNKKQLTRFAKHPVRHLSASDNGTLAFSWDGDIYTMRPGAEPQKLDISIIADQYDGDRVKYFTNRGATTMAVSPSGNEIAFVIRGDVYVTDAKYKTTKRITDTPAQERNVSFSKDGRTLVYDSDRDGYWQLFTATIKNPDEKQFAYATEIEEELLYKCPTAAQQPEYSPDGKKIAFLEDRTEIKVIDPKTKKVNTALDGKYNYSYTDGDVSFTWSPDSKWLLADYIGIGGWNNTDIALVKADGSEVIDLTESGYSNGNAKFALGGKAVTYYTGKYGMKSQGSWGNQGDIVMMALDGEAWDDFRATEEELALKEKAEKEKKEKEEEKDDKDKKGKKNKKDKKDKKAESKKEDSKDLQFDLANRKHRMARLTGSSSFVGDYYMDPKGEKFYYIASATEGGSNLMVRNLKKGDTKVLIKGVSGGLATDAKGEKLFLISGSGMKKVDLAKGSTEDIEFDAPYDRKPSLEREYIYDHMVRQVNDKFYDKDIHGIDWAGYGEHYRQFLPYINNNQDFSILMSEILGELNASHTGSGYRAGGASLQTAELGAFYDPAYTGDGLKVTEVLPRGPLAAKKVDVKPGDVILAIDGKKIEAGKDYYPLLEGKANKKVRLEIKKADGKIEYKDLKPMHKFSLSSHLYDRWVEHNQHVVDSLSGGKVGYVHVAGMDGSSFQTVYDQLLGKYRNCDAVIVDTRFNGGGWLHNDIALLLGGKEYVRFMPRGRYIGSEPFSQWTKPSVMLVNESNYSDAHGTPFVYQTLGIGDVVGAPIPGTMTAVWWETQIDPSLYFGIPQVTSVDMKGNVLENHQLNPDVLIYNNPGDELRGTDAQLEGAVKHLLNKTAKK